MSTTSSILDPSSQLPEKTGDVQQDPSTRPSEKRNPFAGKSPRFWIAFVTLTLTAFISALDAVIIAAALPAITKDLGGSSNQAFWSGTAFLLASTITQPLYGTFSEIFGRRNLLIISLFWFLLGSILCSTSTYMGMLIGSRVIQGIGGGGMIALVEVTVTDMTALSERGAFAGIVALAWALGTVVGPIMGGAIAERTTWRWYFLP
jgi:MFS family permease